MPAGEEGIKPLEEGVVTSKEGTYGRSKAGGVNALLLETLNDVEELQINLGWSEGTKEGGREEWVEEICFWGLEGLVTVDRNKENWGRKEGGREGIPRDDPSRPL